MKNLLQAGTRAGARSRLDHPVPGRLSRDRQPLRRGRARHGAGRGADRLGNTPQQPIGSLQLLSVVLILASGTATFFTRDPTFVMLKPSVIYCIVGW